MSGGRAPQHHLCRARSLPTCAGAESGRRSCHSHGRRRRPRAVPGRPGHQVHCSSPALPNRGPVRLASAPAHQRQALVHRGSGQAVHPALARSRPGADRSTRGSDLTAGAGHRAAAPAGAPASGAVRSGHASCQLVPSRGEPDAAHPLREVWPVHPTEVGHADPLDEDLRRGTLAVAADSTPPCSRRCCTTAVPLGCGGPMAARGCETARHTTGPWPRWRAATGPGRTASRTCARRSGWTRAPCAGGSRGGRSRRREGTALGHRLREHEPPATGRAGEPLLGV
jgi:hypothetical protein